MKLFDDLMGGGKPASQPEWRCPHCGGHDGLSIKPPSAGGAPGGPWCWDCLRKWLDLAFKMERAE